MSATKISLKYVVPVLMAFFIMSFCDLVGIGVDYAKADFELNNTLAQLVPFAVFAWFFFLSVPIGILQDRIGKRNMLNIGMLITAVGLIIPYLIYSFPVLLFGFALLGIGNTILQVSANPLLVDVVPANKSSSFLSLSQFIKAIGSMIAPYMATLFVVRWGNWRILLFVFGITSLISFIWLYFLKIDEVRSSEGKATIKSCLKLLHIPYIALMVVGIFFVVGIDVGINSVSGQFLMENLKMNTELAVQGRSFYFFGKMLGTFLGAIFLTRISTEKFFVGSSVATLFTLLAFIFIPIQGVVLMILFLIGMAAANIFPLIFSLTVKRYNERSNEISGLMIMAVSGGAFFPPIIGKVSDLVNLSAGIFVLIGCALYLLALSIYVWKK